MPRPPLMTDFYAFERYTGDGSTTDFTVTFEYLEKNHITPRVNGVDMSTTSYSWPSDYTIRFNTPPAAGAYVDVKRTTPRDTREVVYQDGSTLNARQMNRLSKQLLYLSQELWDDLRGALHGQNPGDLTGVVPDNDTENDIVAEIASKMSETQLYDDFETQKEDFEKTAATVLNNQTIIEEAQANVTQVEGLASDNAEIQIENALRTNTGIEENRDKAVRIEKVEAETDLDGDGVPDASTTITENSTAIAGVQGKYAVKVDVNGRVTGYGLIQKENDSGELEGTYDILADRFTVTDPDTKEVKLGWNGVQVIVDGNLIVGGSLTADQMNIEYLSALSADLGEVTSGLFKSVDSDSDYRVEMEANSTLPLWYGSGSKAISNALLYVDDTGNAGFGGDLEAASGTFNGSLDAASGTFQGELQAATGTFAGDLTADAVNAVDTLNIAGNAVTVPSGNHVAGTSDSLDGSDTDVVRWVTGASATLNPDGSPVWLNTTACLTLGGYGADETDITQTFVSLRILRDGTVLKTIDRIGGGSYRKFDGGFINGSFVWLDTNTSSGSHTYTVEYGTKHKGSISCEDPALTLMAIKR